MLVVFLCAKVSRFFFFAVASQQTILSIGPCPGLSGETGCVLRFNNVLFSDPFVSKAF